ncbi:phosphatase PAP2 family protein [Fluviispira multicolorata]|uniref:Phosphatase PAP2 family protein n=1 Tax=Fluviispira multicolorata TaxID=2654512 RepID=A0A833JD91_9BACT|nr:phosphatase PAP2 family protein [Fluviispira multicolorata]KAB8031788.1 phosphatase PAP2 family protein [Fluviispira multicolorata]
MFSSPDLPPKETDLAPLSWAHFNPGDLKQDLITLPLEGAIIGAINAFYSPRAESLWPFNHESANKNTAKTTLTRSALLPYSLGVATLVFGGLKLSNDDFFIGTQIRGLLHAHLLNEIATSAAKVSFQRKRPFYDTEVNAQLTPAEDDRFSFFSGHASHAFTFATYTSALMLKYSENPYLSWTYTIAAYSTAAWIALTRVADNAHHVSDVIVGGLVGTVIAGSVFYRVQQIDSINKQMGNTKNNFDFQFIPYTFQDNSKKTWYAGSFEIKF